MNKLNKIMKLYTRGFPKVIFIRLMLHLVRRNEVDREQNIQGKRMVWGMQ